MLQIHSQSSSCQLDRPHDLPLRVATGRYLKWLSKKDSCKAADWDAEADGQVLFHLGLGLSQCRGGWVCFSCRWTPWCCLSPWPLTCIWVGTILVKCLLVCIRSGRRDGESAISWRNIWKHIGIWLRNMYICIFTIAYVSQLYLPNATISVNWDMEYLSWKTNNFDFSLMYLLLPGHWQQNVMLNQNKVCLPGVIPLRRRLLWGWMECKHRSRDWQRTKKRQETQETNMVAKHRKIKPRGQLLNRHERSFLLGNVSMLSNWLNQSPEFV